MQPSPTSHTLTVTVGGVTTVTLQMGSGSFDAFGQTWTYDSGDDRYESSIGWIAFEGQPNTFTAEWGGSSFGGVWS